MGGREGGFLLAFELKHEERWAEGLPALPLFPELRAASMSWRVKARDHFLCDTTHIHSTTHS